VLELRSANAPAARLSPVERGFSDAVLAGRHWRVYSAWGDDGKVLVQVAEDHATRDRIARGIALNALLPLLLALPLLAVAVWWVVSRGLRPLRTLGDDLAARGAQDLEPVPVRGLPDEVAPVVERLNNLLARIQDSLLSERRFTSHAAHELRTPIAAVRAQAEVARAATDPVERQDALERAIQACDRAARLMEQLLLLARADEAQLDASRAPCELQSLAERLLAELAPAVMRAGNSVALDGQGPLRVLGDEALLEAALRNLIDNAIRHGAAGAEVRVQLLAQAGSAIVAVEDSGPGVSEPDLARLGQRFYRAEDTRGAGSGLGLSIVSRIAALHGGDVRFVRGSGGCGLRVELRLPLAG
jgi:two-component system sensor histidine kinase QseC